MTETAVPSLRSSGHHTRTHLILAIDGPSGAGKTSAAQSLAKRLGLRHLDSGALYRAIAWKTLKNKIDPQDRNAVEALCQTSRLSMDQENGDVLLDGEDMMAYLRDPEVTAVSSVIATFPQVRTTLVALQRHMGEQAGLVAEGRDIGTVVFPDADVKFYLDAAAPVRAQRRAQEMHIPSSGLTQLADEMNARDDKDRHRNLAPLLCAKDAIAIDSTWLSLDQVITRMMEAIIPLMRGAQK